MAPPGQALTVAKGTTHGFMLIQPLQSSDYDAIADVRNAVYPQNPRTAEELRFGDEHRDPKCKSQQWVVEISGEVVAYGSFDQSPFVYHPRKFMITLQVHPSHQRNGIGSKLFEHVMQSLELHDPIQLRSFCREDYTDSTAFLSKRGFEELERSWESRLDVASFDFSPYEGVQEKVRSQGIEIKTMRELKNDPDRDRKLHELDWKATQDEPSAEQLTPVSYEYYCTRILQDPNLLPDAYFVAVHDVEYVGVSNLWRLQGSDMIDTGFTGVKRAYRRKGIALALKLRAIAYAKENGYPVIKTDNHSNNRPMLSINERLGFQKQPAWISYVKKIRQETDTENRRT